MLLPLVALQVWLRSKLDVGFAGRLLQLQLQKGSETAAHKRARQLLTQASSLSDLSDYVDHLGPHVAPELLAGACAHAANMLQVRPVARKCAHSLPDWKHALARTCVYVCVRVSVCACMCVCVSSLRVCRASGLCSRVTSLTH